MRRGAPSTWLVWHEALFGPQVRVLDVACGSGRHAIAAALRGADVVAVDADRDKLHQAERNARRQRLAIRWIEADLTSDPLPEGPFDVVMMFNYLDRSRMTKFLDAIRPGGHFLGETFLDWQRTLGWGPTSDEHLLRSGELMSLVEPLEIILGREVLEILDGHPRWIASVLAYRPEQ
ncbi:MAG: class I SAM-dependent methyltransferase [Gemmatimonadales bacterium]